MSRFLTPSKLCLLVLIQSYRNEKAPLKSTIPILSFISSHIIRRSVNQGAEQIGPSPPSLGDFEALLSPQEAIHPGQSLYDVFLVKLWELHDLVTFTDFLQKLTEITQPSQQDEESSGKFVCSPTSPIGQFTRRCHLETVRLQFSDAYQLWESFVLFREPTKAAYISRHPQSIYVQDYPNAASANLLQPETGTASPILVDRLMKRHHVLQTPPSVDDVEKLIHFQLSKLQKYGARVPEEMKAQLEQMSGQGGSTPSEMHFVK